MADRTEETAASRRAFEALVRVYHKSVLAYALSLVQDEPTAEDLAQEAFLTAFMKMSRFDPQRDFGAWVRGILRMKYLEWKRERREMPLDEQLLELVEERYDAWDAAAREREENLLGILRRCLDRLGEAMRGAVDLFYFGRAGCEAIAEQTGATLTTVQQRLHRARSLLRECVRTTLSRMRRHRRQSNDGGTHRGHGPDRGRRRAGSGLSGD